MMQRVRLPLVTPMSCSLEPVPATLLPIWLPDPIPEKAQHVAQEPELQQPMWQIRTEVLAQPGYYSRAGSELVVSKCHSLRLSLSLLLCLSNGKEKRREE